MIEPKLRRGSRIRGVPHVVVSDTRIFKSQALDTDDRFSYTFTKPGTFLYYCMIHPKMTAKVVVQ